MATTSLRINTYGALGFQLVEEVGSHCPVVGQIAPDGSLSREHHNRVHRGDVLCSVNGRSTAAQQLTAVLDAIKGAGRPLELTFRRPGGLPLAVAESPRATEQRALRFEFNRVAQRLSEGFDATARSFDAIADEQSRAREELHDALDTKFRILDRVMPRNGIATASHELARAHADRCAMALQIAHAMLAEIHGSTLDADVARARRELSDANAALARQTKDSEAARLCVRLRAELQSATATAARAAGEVSRSEGALQAERAAGARLAERLRNLNAQRDDEGHADDVDEAAVEAMRAELRTINLQISEERRRGTSAVRGGGVAVVGSTNALNTELRAVNAQIAEERKQQQRTTRGLIP